MALLMAELGVVTERGFGAVRRCAVGPSSLNRMPWLPAMWHGLRFRKQYRNGRRLMRITTAWTRAAIRPLTVILVAAILLLAGCGSDSDSSGDSSGFEAEAEAETNSDKGGGDNSSAGDDSSDGDDAGPSPSGGAVSFGSEEISMQPLFCYFEEQPRAGLGGIFTHTAQAQGTNAAGEPVLLDMSRAVAEDGTVEYDLSFGVGDPFSDDHTEFYDTGQEVMFGDNSVSASGDVNDFESGPVTLTFDLPCS